MTSGTGNPVGGALCLPPTGGPHEKPDLPRKDLNMPPLLQAQELVKRYTKGGAAAVSGISFQVERGEVFGLLGPNGAGKTTTISMLTALLVPTSGTATLAGFDVVRQPREVKKRIGLVPQELALYPTLSARDNLRFFGRLNGLSGRKLAEAVDRNLARVGLSDRGDDAIATFSGGMKRRVNIAAGLLHEPEILFLDEPTVGVDPQSRNFILDGIETLSRDGLTVIFSTHYMEEAERICRRIAVVDEGRVLALDTPAELVHSLGDGTVSVSGAVALEEPLLAALRRLPEVTSAEPREGGVLIAARQPILILPAVIELFQSSGLPITSLEYAKPTLESVFLQLTGKGLRN
jgi:ABC-2 type transport system ATP-binding protein